MLPIEYLGIYGAEWGTGWVAKASAAGGHKKSLLET